MSRRKPPPWTIQEIAILREHYPSGGLNGVADLLPDDRTWQAIQQQAWKLGIRSERIRDAPRPKLAGANLEEAVRLREEQGWSFARIGATFGVCESAANNAVTIAMCTRKGFRPAERDAHGRLTADGLERLRLMLRKGLKGCEIQLRLGVSAACVAEQRRRYRRYLKERGKSPLPPPGAGERYSGARIPRAITREIQELYLDGFGTAKISARTGVSKTHCLRTRTKLVKKLKREGKTLCGCDLDGTRHVQKDSARFIPAAAIEELRNRLLDGTPVRSAALELGIGSSSAYRIRDALIVELQAQGRLLPRNNWRLGVRGASKPPAITGPRNIYRLRELARSMPLDEARKLLLDEIQEERRLEAREIGGAIEALAKACRAAVIAERQRPRTFEEQLEALERGAKLTPAFRPSRSIADRTFGGVATGMLG